MKHSRVVFSVSPEAKRLSTSARLKTNIEVLFAVGPQKVTSETEVSPISQYASATLQYDGMELTASLTITIFYLELEVIEVEQQLDCE